MPKAQGPLCDAVGISRTTGSQWVARYERDGAAGLLERARRPHTSRRATPPAIVARLVEARQRPPLWSARKLIRVLPARAPEVAWPKRSTGCERLRRNGLVRVRRRARRGHAPVTPLPPIMRPNDVWTTDFNGEFRTGDGLSCYPLTRRDGFRRYVLRCEALDTRRTEPVRRRFERAFAEYGLPDRIRSDNGGPLAASGLTRLSPGRPVDSAGHPSRAHCAGASGTKRVARAISSRVEGGDDSSARGHPQAQQRRFTTFCAEYNHERPHEALGDRPPASVYRPSPREWPRQLPVVAYPGDLEVRRVSTGGVVSWRNQPLYLTEVLNTSALKTSIR